MRRLCELRNVIGFTLEATPVLANVLRWYRTDGTVSTKHFRSAYLWPDNGLGPIGQPLIDTHRQTFPKWPGNGREAGWMGGWHACVYRFSSLSMSLTTDLECRY